TRRGKTTGPAKNIMHSQNVKHTTQQAVRQSLVHPTTTGTHQNSMHTHAAHNTKHTTTKNQMHWHTIEFSNNTSTPKPTHTRRQVQSD
ncbi:hypothetical protein, partial [Corynebacterium lujinxingii]